METKNLTILLCGKMGTTVAFQTTQEKYKELYPNFPLELISKDHANNIGTPLINLTGKDEIDIKISKPVFLQINSLHILHHLHLFFPSKRFVVLKRWEDIEYKDPDVWDEYKEVLELDAEYILDNGGRLEVKDVHDCITITRKHDSLDDLNECQKESFAEKVTVYPGWSTADHLDAYYCGFDYDKLYIFEEEVYNKLEIIEPEGEVLINGKNYPYAPKLILDTEVYNKPLKFI